MQNPSVLNRCTAQRGNGDFCDMPSLVDMPFPICKNHADKVYRRLSENMDAKRQALVRADGAVIASDRKASMDARQSERTQALNEQSVLYYVRIGDHIKIGTSKNLKARLSALRIEPEAVMATEPGGYKLERQRHILFAAERVGRRENFNPSQRLLDHVEAVRARHGQPAITTYPVVAG